MMNARTVCLSHAAITAIFLCAASPALAEIYKWKDADGSVTLSNQPPADRSKVTELTKIEDINTVPSDQHPKEPLAAQPEIRGTDSTLALPESVTPELEVPAGKAESASPAPQLAPAITPTPRPALVTAPPTTLLQQEPVTLLPRESGAPQREAEIPPARVIPRSTHTEAVQDPCLTSSDPKCYQRNKDRYHPYLGYAPGIQSTGTTTEPGAGGVARGGQGAAPNVVAPRSSAHALPPGSASPAAVSTAKQPNAMR